MTDDEARALSREAAESEHPLRDAWYCGLINRKIETATEQGQYEVRIRYNAKSFVVKHRERFKTIYESQGYTVSFRPNYVQITPTQYDMIISWAHA